MQLLSERMGVGASLRDVSVAMAHRYAVLGWIKGSKDGHVANTLLQFDSGTPSTSAITSSSTTIEAPTTSRLSNFLDCDDEFLLGANLAFGTEENNNLPLWKFGFLRMWQMGLPQSAVPFSRAELFLLATSNISHKLAQLNRNCRWIKPEDLEQQRLRVDALEMRAKQAFDEGTSFSMRDLYHEVVTDADKVADVARQFPPILAYDLPRMPDWDPSFNTPTFAQNMHDLYQQ